jgi:hypothetical protein
MRHKVTSRTRQLVADMHRAAELVVPCLGRASAAARDEWALQRAAWPSDDDLRQGTTDFGDEDLEALLAKVRRFAEILSGHAVDWRSNKVASPRHAAA